MTQQTQVETAPSSELGWLGISGGTLFWYFVALIIAFFTSRTFNDLLYTRWGLVFAIPPVIALLIGLTPPARNALKKATIGTRAAVFILVTLPVLFLIVGSVFFLVHDADTRAKLLRIAFLIVVCILPAMMWFLFIVTRKASILNGFLVNLDRLGLLDLQEERGEKETEGSRQRRIESCLQRFEATYGTLPEEIHTEVLSGDFKYYSRADTAAAGTLSTATLPVALFTFLVAIGWLITLPPTELGSSKASVWIRAFDPVQYPVTLAFLGAYFFSVQMLFRRYVLKDLGGAAYVAASIRIVLAVIGIWLVAAVGPVGASDGPAQKQWLSWENQLLLYGFVFGVFPRVIWQIIQSLFVRVARFALPGMVSRLPLSDLDGLTVWHEARLEEEDIENIPNMANADLVELLLNTRLSPEQVIDWADQAILYTQLGPMPRSKEPNPRDKLRMHGIRTATSLLHTSETLLKSENRGEYNNILTDAKGGSLMPALEASICTNSNLKRVVRWRRFVYLPLYDAQPGSKMKLEEAA